MTEESKKLLTFDDMPDAIKLAWAAGFFEAKVRIYETDNELQFFVYDKSVAEKFQRVVGVGSVRDKQLKYVDQTRFQYEYHANTVVEVVALLMKVIPFLNEEKRTQAMKKVNKIKNSPYWKRTVVPKLEKAVQQERDKANEDKI